MQKAARVCIAMPVYNGEKYVADAIESALAQTYLDLELVIVDNVSTDDTANICRAFAARDERVRYIRCTEHLGVADNFTRAFRQCRSTYFKWAASDDLLDPTFVEKCVAVLDADPDVVVCYGDTAIVDETGAVTGRDGFVLDLGHPNAATRFRRLVMAPPKHHGAHEQYGVIRADVLRRTGIMSNHVMGCRVLLAELAMRGRLVRIEEVLFFNRDHGGRSQRGGRPNARPGSVLTAWLPIGAWPPSEFWNPRLRGRIVFPEFDITGQWLKAVMHTPLSERDRLRCLCTLAGLLLWRLPKYGRDIAIGTEQAVRLTAKGRLPWHGGLHEYFGAAAGTIDAPSLDAAAPEGRTHPAESKTRVAFIDHCARLSGAEMALLRLVPALGDVEALVVLGEDGPLRRRLEAVGVDVVVLPLPRRTATLRRERVRWRIPLPVAIDIVSYTWRLRRLLRERNIEVVHTNSLKACLYGGMAGRLAGLPVVWHARDRYHEDYLPKAAVRLVHLAVRLLATVVIANSQTTMAALAPHPHRQRRIVLSNPLDSPTYDVGTQRLDLYRRGRVRDRPLVVGLVGRMSPWKGQDVFLRAFAEAFGEHGLNAVGARMIGAALFGEDAYADSMRQLAVELRIEDRVEWRGFREDVAAELAELDVLVHCSTIPEPFGQVVVEGMAAALPVVSTNVGGPAEVIDHGRTGLLVQPGDPTGLAAVLRRLVGDRAERERLGSAAHQAADAYRDFRVASRFDAIFRSLSSSHAAPQTAAAVPPR